MAPVTDPFDRFRDLFERALRRARIAEWVRVGL